MERPWLVGILGGARVEGVMQSWATLETNGDKGHWKVTLAEKADPDNSAPQSQRDICIF